MAEITQEDIEQDQAEQDGKNRDEETKKLLEEKARLEVQVKERDEYARKESEARAKAEGAVEALKSAQVAAQTGAVREWGDAEWEAFQAKTGLSKDAFLANAQVAKTLVDGVRQEFSGKVSAAEERAKKAEERAERVEAERRVDETKRSFFKAKPALARYEADVDEFLAQFPEADRKNPERLKALLPLAETYVKGKVGDKMRTTPGGSPRLGSGGEDVEEHSGDEIDLEGLENDHEIDVVKRIHARTKGREAELKPVESRSKKGIRLGGEQEWGEAASKLNKEFNHTVIG